MVFVRNVRCFTTLLARIMKDKLMRLAKMLWNARSGFAYLAMVVLCFSLDWEFFNITGIVEHEFNYLRSVELDSERLEALGVSRDRILAKLEVMETRSYWLVLILVLSGGCFTAAASNLRKAPEKRKGGTPETS